MATTRDELERFHQFAIGQLERSESSPDLDELGVSWCDTERRGEINDIIRQGLADLEAGLGRPAELVNGELERKYGLAVA
jgi:hypothetical protein